MEERNILTIKDIKKPLPDFKVRDSKKDEFYIFGNEDEYNLVKDYVNYNFNIFLLSSYKSTSKYFLKYLFDDVLSKKGGKDQILFKDPLSKEYVNVCVDSGNGKILVDAIINIILETYERCANKDDVNYIDEMLKIVSPLISNTDMKIELFEKYLTGMKDFMTDVLRNNIELSDMFEFYVPKLAVEAKNNFEIVLDYSSLFSFYNSFGEIIAGEIARKHENYLIVDANTFIGLYNTSFYGKLLSILENGKERIEELGIELNANTHFILSGIYSDYVFIKDNMPELLEKMKIVELKNICGVSRESMAMVYFFSNKKVGEDGLKIEKDASKRIVEYLLQKNDYVLPLNFSEIENIAKHSAKIAKARGSKKVEVKDIDDTFENIKRGINKYERITRSNTIDIYKNVKEREIGVVNGIMVYIDLDEFAFPFRIITTIGGKEKRYVDKECGFVGNSSKKAFENVKMFLYTEFKDYKDVLDNIGYFLTIQNFYDNYSGDSLTMAMLSSIISEISGIKMFQNVFVTGSLDPRTGNALPVGLVSTKILGVYKTCKELGINGVVAIPSDNVDDVYIFDEELIEDIKRGNFFILCYDNWIELMEILSGLEKKEILKRIEEGFKKLSTQYIKD